MVNLSYLLLRDFRQQDSTVNVLDLKGTIVAANMWPKH